jgi:hypothetical protein
VALLRAWIACTQVASVSSYTRRVRCGAAACLDRVLSEAALQGHTEDLPGLTVRVRSAMLYAPERLSLRLMAMTRAGAWKECLNP